MVVLLLAGLLANWSAPRRLQLFGFASQTEAAVKDAPDGSSVRSTVIVVFGALGTILGSTMFSLSTITSPSPFSFCCRGNTATGALCASRVVLVKPLVESTESCPDLVAVVFSVGLSC